MTHARLDLPLVSLAFVWGLTGWCFYKVLTVKDPENLADPPAVLGA